MFLSISSKYVLLLSSKYLPGINKKNKNADIHETHMIRLLI